jgi:hypothetical protein
MTTVDPPPLRDIDWLSHYLGRSRQWTTANAAVFGGFRVGREWRFRDTGIAAGIDQLAAQAAPAPVPQPRRSRAGVVTRIQHQLT